MRSCPVGELILLAWSLPAQGARFLPFPSLFWQLLPFPSDLTSFAFLCEVVYFNCTKQYCVEIQENC